MARYKIAQLEWDDTVVLFDQAIYAKLGQIHQVLPRNLDCM